jgi:membrane protease YdiL (CAAX protease family)
LGGVRRTEGLKLYALIFVAIVVFAAIALVLQGVVEDGGTRAAWHLPREFAQVVHGAEIAPIAMGQVSFFATTTALMVIISYAVNRTGGSVLPAIVIHGANNYLSGAMGGRYVFLTFGVIGVMEIVIAVVIVLVAGTELGRRPERRPDLEFTSSETAGIR